MKEGTGKVAMKNETETTSFAPLNIQAEDRWASAVSEFAHGFSGAGPVLARHLPVVAAANRWTNPCRNSPGPFLIPYRHPISAWTRHGCRPSQLPQGRLIPAVMGGAGGWKNGHAFARGNGAPTATGNSFNLVPQDPLEALEKTVVEPLVEEQPWAKTPRNSNHCGGTRGTASLCVWPSQFAANGEGGSNKLVDDPCPPDGGGQ